jgi:hypothetical protein
MTMEALPLYQDAVKAGCTYIFFIAQAFPHIYQIASLRNLNEFLRRDLCRPVAEHTEMSVRAVGLRALSLVQNTYFGKVSCPGG